MVCDGQMKEGREDCFVSSPLLPLDIHLPDHRRGGRERGLGGVVLKFESTNVACDMGRGGRTLIYVGGIGTVGDLRNMWDG